MLPLDGRQVAGPRAPRSRSSARSLHEGRIVRTRIASRRSSSASAQSGLQPWLEHLIVGSRKRVGRVVFRQYRGRCAPPKGVLKKDAVAESLVESALRTGVSLAGS